MEIDIAFCWSEAEPFARYLIVYGYKPCARYFYNIPESGHFFVRQLLPSRQRHTCLRHESLLQDIVAVATKRWSIDDKHLCRIMSNHLDNDMPQNYRPFLLRRRSDSRKTTSSFLRARNTLDPPTTSRKQPNQRTRHRTAHTHL
jgi:hypothetical protein